MFLPLSHYLLQRAISGSCFSFEFTASDRSIAYSDFLGQATILRHVRGEKTATPSGTRAILTVSRRLCLAYPQLEVDLDNVVIDISATQGLMLYIAFACE